MTPSELIQVLKAFGGKNAFKDMGVFMRSLSAFYSLRDCERLIEETILRIQNGFSPDLPAEHCVFNLNDVIDVLGKAKGKPKPYPHVKNAAKALKTIVNKGRKLKSIGLLNSALNDVRYYRKQIATTTELP